MDDQRLSHFGITHVDTGALRFFKSLGCHTMLDVGCGPGGMASAALDIGYIYRGIDLCVPEDLDCSPLYHWDLERAPYPPEIFDPILFDLVWCVEVAEHVKNEYNILRTISRATGKYAVVTWNPGPGGFHVNPREMDYWTSRLEGFGIYRDEKTHAELLKASSMRREFLQKNGMTFVAPGLETR